MAQEKTFNGRDGDLLVFGTTEGDGAPILRIAKYADGTWASFCFADPAQVSLLIRTLVPFADARAL